MKILKLINILKLYQYKRWTWHRLENPFLVFFVPWSSWASHDLRVNSFDTFKIIKGELKFSHLQPKRERKAAVCAMWQVASHISTAASINSSTNTCKPKQMGQTGSFPPQIKGLTCGPHEVKQQHQRQGETIKTQRDRIAQKRNMSSRSSQYVFFTSCPEVSLECRVREGRVLCLFYIHLIFLLQF